LKISFLNDQLEKNTLGDINNVFFKMIEDQLKNNMLANVADGYVFKVLDHAIEARSNHKPKRLQITFLGFFIGLFIGILCVYIFKSRKN
jgi:capsular polysaccharide biosynthesis protein